MKSSIYIAKIAGIKVFIHWTFFLLIIWIVAASIQQGNNVIQIVFSIAFVLTLFVCVILHEFGHALAAKRFNYKTNDIILLPIGGLARMKEIPENPKQELIVAIAGPLVNLVIALILYPFVIWPEIDPTTLAKLVIGPSNFIFLLYSANLTLAVFNLIPAFPMDGGRVFRAILAMKMDRVKATSIAAATGQSIAILFFILGLIFNPILVLIAIFVFIIAKAENDYVRSKSILQAYKVEDVMTKHFYKLDQSSTIKEVVKLLVDTEITNFIITDQEQIIGTLNRDEILTALIEKGENAKVQEVMNKHIKIINKNIKLDDIFSELKNNGTTIMPVIENNSLKGTVSMNNILEFIKVKKAMQKYLTSASKVNN